MLDLAPLGIEPICYLTEEISNQLLAKYIWYSKHITVSHEESTTNLLARMGFQRRIAGTYIKAPEAVVEAWLNEDYSTLLSEFKVFHSPTGHYWQLGILTTLPLEKAVKAWNALTLSPHTDTEYAMLHFGLKGLPGLVNSLARYPQEALPITNYFAASELAPAVARAFNKLKTLRENARSWLLKYPEHALTGLLPAALGKAGEAQDNARAALRMLTENGHQPLLQEIARRYNQPEVTDAVNALLALDPLDNHPTKIPTLPAFYQPSLWTRPVLKANAQSLPDRALLHLGEMLRFPQEEVLYPGILQVKDACTADSLAEFAWDLFTAWQTAGAPSKESWAFTALGVLGNDDTARKLTPLIRAWPGESQHKRATVGLDILAAIGSDIALMQLNGIAQKLKFKALQERAKEKIADIAESRELTVAELEDRLAPDLGLDDNGSLLLDFGPRQFTVSFDETLKPFVRDASGSRLKDLPKPNKSDDESQANDAVNRYKLLKKDARMALIQLHHISQRAKSSSLRENAAEFLQVVAENRGLSQEELADRLVPTLGLDDPQALIFDFGPRQFTVRFDENLNPVIFDQQNVRQKSVPRLRADDDQLKAPEALARLKGLKKDATQVSKNLLPRLEAALRTIRRWSLADFHTLFVNHPFTRLVTQRLIWGVYPANEPRCLLNAFRVAAEGEFCNAQDEPIGLPADALIGIAHPLEMTAEMRSEFAQLFADYEIMPPFRQLSRRTVLLTPDELTSNSLTRWEGKSATVGQLMGMRYKGWESGYEDAFVYDLGEYRLVLKFSPGFNHYNVDSKALMSFRSLRVYRDNKSVTFAELDVFDLSEALSAPDVIFH